MFNRMGIDKKINKNYNTGLPRNCSWNSKSEEYDLWDFHERERYYRDEIKNDIQSKGFYLDEHFISDGHVKFVEQKCLEKIIKW